MTTLSVTSVIRVCGAHSPLVLESALNGTLSDIEQGLEDNERVQVGSVVVAIDTESVTNRYVGTMLIEIVRYEDDDEWTV